VDALTEALVGQHAVVDATFSADDTPQRLIDASVAAGVYRYVPSDFGFDPMLPGERQTPLPLRILHGPHMSKNSHYPSLEYTSRL
jgi:hypothetical protein